MTTQAVYDYIILGAGPAGVQMGYFLAKQGRRYLILEAGETAGSFFNTFPRHGKLISINKVYTGCSDTEVNLRWDWNSLLSDEEFLFKNYSKEYFPPAPTLVQYLHDFTTHFQLPVQYNTRIEHITRDHVFSLRDTQGNCYQAQRLIVATGVSKPYVPSIPGIEHAELYTEVSMHPEDFINQRVLILGKGNSAFETADNLVGTAASIHLASPNSVKMAWQTHFPGNLRAVNNNILDTYQLKSQNAILDASIERIDYHDGTYTVTVSYTHAAGEQETLQYDRVIVCTGFRFDASIFDDTCRPRLTINDRLPEQTCEWESTNVDGLYFAGTLMQMRDYKRTTSAFIHGFRYSVRALANIFAQKYHNEPWPSAVINSEPTALTAYVVTRINRTSALWQQFGTLGDVIVPGRESTAHYYAEMPVDYVHELATMHQQEYYLLTLEYGPHHVSRDPFNVERIARHDVRHANQSQFLHPIIRRFVGTQLISEHHVIEDLASEWKEDVHIQPLLAYFTREQAFQQTYQQAA